ncbi:MAG: class I SAM-dependent methyltransferase, partial [Bacteroidia bacterium]|nr:class I SAM-dependent methyltransferase [Bacteroidia bacterium]
MLHSLKEFIRYFWLADSKYKVHSPFVYNLAIALFDNRAHSFDEIEKIRSQLLKDRTNLEVVDYGAGSKFQHSAQRSIQSIARTAVSNKRKCITLKSIVQLLRPSSILELGTSLGISTAYISRTLETSNIITIEGSHGIAAVATNVFEALNLNNVTQLVDAIDMALPQLIENGDKFDLIYADGNHTEAATTRYFEWFLELTNKDSVILLDDIY